jgi:hypothetical protein
MVKHVSEKTRAKTRKTTRGKKRSEINQEEEEVLQKAAIYCLRTFPMLWTVGGIKKDSRDDGACRWIIAVYLRYPTGFEGYLGDLLFDGKQVTELTDREVMRTREKQIAADPERMRKWNEYRAATVQAGER